MTSPKQPRVPRSSPRRASPPVRSRGYLLLPVALVIAVVAAVAFLMSRQSAVDVSIAGGEAEGAAAGYVAEAGLRHALWKASAGACSGYSLPSTPFGAHSYEAVFTPDSGSPVSLTVTGTLASGASRTIRRDGVTIGAAPSTLTVQPDPADAADTYIHDSSPTTNFGTEIQIRISEKANNKKRGLLRFDLSSINPAATVSSAELELNFESIGSGGTATIYLHRAEKLWVEGQATWNQYAAGANWDTPGGDYAIPEITSNVIDSAAPGATTFTLTDAVQGWVEDPAINYGVMMIGSAGVNHADFTTSDSSNTALRPKLTVTYACACGVACLPAPPSCDADFTADSNVGEFSTAGQSYRYNRGMTYFPEGQSINGSPAPSGGGWIAVGESGRLVLLDLAGNIIDDGFDTGLANLEGVAFVPAGPEVGHLAIVSGNTLYFSDPTVLPASSSYTTNTLAFLGAAGGVSYIDGGTYDGHLAIADSASEEILIVDQSSNLVTTLSTSAIVDAPKGVAHLKDTDKFLVADKNLNRAFVIDTALTVSQNYDLAPFGYGEPAAAAIHPTLCHHVVGDHTNDRYVSLNVGSGSGVLDVRIDTGSDDAEELVITNGVDLNSTDLELTEDLGFQQIVGMRFPNLTIPGGATITNAYIQFTTAAKNTGPSNLNIQGELIDDAPTFVSADSNISSRIETTASVAWSPSNWNTVGEAGPNQRTPDLSSVIQEIVDRPGWASGNAIVILVTGTKTRTAESFEGSAAAAPLLHIEY